MEYFLHRLPPRPRSPAVRLAITTGLVGVAFLILIGLRQSEGVLGFFVLLPAIFVASLLFGRFAGVYGTGLSVALLYLVLTPGGTMLLPRVYILPLILFTLVALSFALMSGGLRTAWERAVTAEKAKNLLLEELGHRIKNNLAMVISMLSMQAQSKSNPDTRAALEKAIARIHAIASAHEHFRPMQKGRIEMRAYLHELCNHLGAMLRDVRPIAVRVDSEEIYLPAQEAVSVGLIVNELVTNALKHAFPEDRAGAIDVVFRRNGGLELLVKDDGIGCAADLPQGIGSRLIRLLGQQMGAQVLWERCEPGCQVRVAFYRATRSRDPSESAQLSRAATEDSPTADVLKPHEVLRQ